MRNTTTKPVLLGVLLALLAGCASLAASEHEHILQVALRDDQACMAKGFKYPDPIYVSCRMQLQDDRLHQDWLNLQLMRQTQVQPTGVPAPYSPREQYRPLNRDHYDCQQVIEDKHEYILCDATDAKDQQP
ncbi:MAG: hypothetical protein ACM3ZT_10490 [Bacillota bacterium]